MSIPTIKHTMHCIEIWRRHWNLDTVLKFGDGSEIRDGMEFRAGMEIGNLCVQKTKCQYQQSERIVLNWQSLCAKNTMSIPTIKHTRHGIEIWGRYWNLETVLKFEDGIEIWRRHWNWETVLKLGDGIEIWNGIEIRDAIQAHATSPPFCAISICDNSMLPKRRFLEIGTNDLRAFSTHFSTLLGPIRVLTSLKSASEMHANRLFRFPKIFVWGA